MSGEHEIEGLLATTMAQLRQIVDVNTIVGEVIESNGVSVIPVSRLSCGFAAGGGSFPQPRERSFASREPGEPPFSGGSGAGLNISPVAFLVLQEQQVRLIPISGATGLDTAIEAVPLVAEQVQRFLGKKTDGPPTGTAPTDTSSPS